MTHLLDMLGTIVLIVGIVLWVAMMMSAFARREEAPSPFDSRPLDGAEEDEDAGTESQ